MVDPFAALNTAIDVARQLRGLEEKITDLTFKTLLSDLMSSLADSKIEQVNLKDQLVALREENAELKRKIDICLTPLEEHTIRWGSYYFNDDPTPYCIKCYQLARKKHPTVRNMQNTQCTVCGNEVRR
jgi:hypothetical protein